MRRRPSAHEAAIRKMMGGAALLAAVFVVGSVGYVIAGWTAQDALYMVVITIFGVGYGEIQPVSTWPLRVLTVFVIVAGYAAVIYTVGGFIQMVIDGQLNKAFGARRMKKDIDALTGHTIVCGFGRMGRSLAAELQAVGHPFVAIDSGPEAAEHAELHGMLFLNGDASDEDLLRAAGIERAAVLAAVISDDATNVFVTLTARAMEPELRIIARGENRRTEEKLRKCGADEVVLATEIGASRIAHQIVRPTAEEMFESISGASGDLDLRSMGLEFDEIELHTTSPLANRLIGEIEVRGAHAYLIVGIRSIDGTTTMHPSADMRLAIGDRLIVLGYEDDLPALAAKAGIAARTLTYRGATS
ncbi:MAG: potassium channel protein [Acidimicrobiales bacterium]